MPRKYKGSSHPPPEGFAKVDNQGKLGVCTRSGLSKALANGFMSKKFVSGKNIDIDQQVIMTALVNTHKVYSICNK